MQYNKPHSLVGSSCLIMNNPKSLLCLMFVGFFFFFLMCTLCQCKAVLLINDAAFTLTSSLAFTQ